MFSFVLYYCFHICIVYLYCTVLTVYTTVTNTVSCIHSLSYPVKLIDARLGFFQKTFGLTGNQGEVWIYINLPDLCVSVRQLAVSLNACRTRPARTPARTASDSHFRWKMFPVQAPACGGKLSQILD